jgi:dTDP-4-dehydrorhamnose 3,5-epimerase
MSFRRLDTRLDGLVLIEPDVFPDSRGFFLETFREDGYKDMGIDAEFVQDNHSRSQRGSIRAFHFQVEPGQAKLVRAARGTVHDVAIDLRRDSPTYGQHEAFELSD